MRRSPDRVYFARRATDGAIKIGTSRHVDRRIIALSKQHASAIVLLATTAGGFAREAEVHDALADHRISGEWFAPSDVVLAAARTGGLALPTRESTRPGERLREWRLRAAMTLEDVARAVRTAGGSSVHGWERGPRRPRVHFAIALDRLTDGAIPCEAWGYEPLASLTSDPIASGS